MKLATLDDGTPEGRLVVVSRDVTHCADARRIAPNLLAALDDWPRVAPVLAALARDLALEACPMQRFHERAALPPVPHPRGAPAPRLLAARADGAPGPLSARMVAVTAEGEAGPTVALFMLGLESGDGALALSPVAVTPDELGAAWGMGRLARPARLTVAGAAYAQPDAPAGVDVAALARAAAAAHGPAGALIVTALPIGDAGGRRAPPGETPLRGPGQSARLELRDAGGHTIFGAIESVAPGAEAAA
jgi:fumarylacetoacetate (FAA) hydrolase